MKLKKSGKNGTRISAGAVVIVSHAQWAFPFRASWLCLISSEKRAWTLSVQEVAVRNRLRRPNSALNVRNVCLGVPIIFPYRTSSKKTSNGWAENSIDRESGVFGFSACFPINLQNTAIGLYNRSFLFCQEDTDEDTEN